MNVGEFYFPLFGLDPRTRMVACRQIKTKRVTIVVKQPKRSGHFTDYFLCLISSISLSFFCLKSPELLFKATEQKTTMAMALWLLFSPFLFLSVSANTQTKVTDNPADELVAVLNTNRTAHKSSSLTDNPGLACIALQYIKAYQGDCNAVGGPDAKKPADSQFAETFAPNCGVDVSTLSPITGRLLGCQSKYVQPHEAFSMLTKNEKSLEILYNKNHTEVGAAATGTDGGAPYFWCVLFSSGKHNSSFVLEGGVAKITKPGCFSGANDDCSGADDSLRSGHAWLYAVTAFIAVAYAFGL